MSPRVPGEPLKPAGPGGPENPGGPLGPVAPNGPGRPGEPVAPGIPGLPTSKCDKHVNCYLLFNPSGNLAAIATEKSCLKISYMARSAAIFITLASLLGLFNNSSSSSKIFITIKIMNGKIIN